MKSLKHITKLLLPLVIFSVQSKTYSNIPLDTIMPTLSDTIKTDSIIQSAASHLKSLDNIWLKYQFALNPIQTLQGVIPGLSVTRPGSNPFEPFIVRSRGIHSFDFPNTQPLVYIDNMSVNHIELLDPYWIEDVGAYLDAFSASRYGVQGNRPIIHFRSESPNTYKGFRIEYLNLFSIENLGRQIQVADRQKFIQLGGPDLGHDHVWMEEVSRTGFSQQHRLKVGYGWKNTQLIASGMLRNIQSILKHSGGKWLNSHIALKQSAFREKIKVNIQSWQYQQDNIYGFPEAFVFARKFKPTAPKRDEGFEEYGGYYQELIFNQYNPIAIIEQNSSKGSKSGSLHIVQSEFEFPLNFKGHVSAGKESFTEDFTELFDPESFYRGATSVSGIAEKTDVSSTKLWWLASLHHVANFNSWTFENNVGYEWKNHQRERSFNFNSTEYTHDEYLKSENRIINLFGDFRAKYRELFTVEGKLTHSGSNWLGRNNKWGWFYGFRASTDLNKIINLPGLQSFHFSLSHGKSGNQPYRGDMAIYVLDPQGKFYFNGQYEDIFGYRHDKNPNLKWEEKREWELRTSTVFAQGRININLSLFWNRTKDLIREIYLPQPLSLTGSQWQNVGKISNKGWEFTIESKLLEKQNLQFSSRLSLYRFRPFLDEFPDEVLTVGGGCGCGSPYSPIRIYNQQELGQLRAPEIEYNRTSEKYEVIDKNGNDYEDDGDEILVGNAYPSWNLGWQNRVQMGAFEFFFSFRGAYGHHLINNDRLLYEYRNVVNNFNAVTTRYFERNNASYPRFGARYVEKAGFLNLDNLYLSFKPYSQNSTISGLVIFAGARNLITISKYTGGDPEVRYQHAEYDQNGSLNEKTYGAVTSGLASDMTYPHTRTWFLGIKIEL